jgi:ABC-type nitrate/sulfonate/bicarbonate transport system substrate-binding protein
VWIRFFVPLLGQFKISPQDLTIRTIADPAAMVSALREKQVDGFIFSPPVTERPVMDGFGGTWIDFVNGDVPALKEMPSTLLITTPAVIDKNPEALHRFIRPLQASFAEIHSNPDKVRDGIKTSPYFKEMDNSLYRRSFQAVLPAFKAGAAPTRKSFDAMKDLYNNDRTVKMKSTTDFEQTFDVRFYDK